MPEIGVEEEGTDPHTANEERHNEGQVVDFIDQGLGAAGLTHEVSRLWKGDIHGLFYCKIFQLKSNYCNSDQLFENYV